MLEGFQTISLNSSNLDDNGFNNKYSVQFPSGFSVDENTAIAVSQVSLFFSWFNISSILGNNRLDLIFPTSTTPTTITLTIPDGYYSVSTLNEYLQTIMIANNLYMTDSNGNNVYYLEVITNPTYYSVDFNFYTIPTTTPTGYTSYFATLPVLATTPQITIPIGGFSTYSGITAGTYPATTTASTSQGSTNTPQVDNVQSIILSCDAIDNRLSSRPTLLYSFPINATFGGLITSNPNEYVWMSPRTGTLPRLTIEFLDQSYNKINLKDTNVLISLVVKRSR
jgi:hypothetical protein